MILGIQLAVLTVATISLIVRWPAYRRAPAGSSARYVFHMLILLEVAVLLWIRPISEALDQALTIQISNLLLRVVVFIGMALVAYSMANSFKYWQAARMVGGWAGLVIIALCASLITVAMLLGANQANIGETTLGNVLYTMTWRGYWAYIGVILIIVLIPPMISSTRRPLLRVGAGFISLFGLCGIIALGMSISAYALPATSPATVLYVTDGIAVLGLLIGLLLFWASKWNLLPKNLLRLRKSPSS